METLINRDQAQLYIVRHYRWNFTVNSLNAAFYTVAMTFASIITFLPLFIEKLGGSNLLIGLIPSVAFLGYQLPGLFSANYVEGLHSKLRFVQKITLFERLPFLVLALLCLTFARTHPAVAIVLTFICLVFITFTSGAITPAWFDYISKVTPRHLLGTYFATGSGTGGIIGIGASLLATHFLASYAFPLNFFYCFFCGFIAVMISYLMTLLGKEPPMAPTNERTKLWDYYRKMPAIIKKDQHLKHFIIIRNLQCMGSMASTFLSIYGIKVLALPDQSAGWMTMVLLFSQSLSFFLWGFIGDRFNHKIVLSCGALGLVLSSAIVLLFSSYSALLIAFVCLGSYWASLGTSGLAILRDFAPEGRYPTYLALNNGLTLLAAFSAPVIGGKIADLYSYRMIFWLALFFSLWGLFWLLRFIPYNSNKASQA